MDSITIGLISDSHGYIGDDCIEVLQSCDEIWHAGDFGDISVSDQLSLIKPLKGVYGNIDGGKTRIVHPLHQKFEVQGLKIWMTHIGGYPGKYNREIKKDIIQEKPDLFICGHSHILKVARDQNLGGMLCLNPGAIGKSGFHKNRTMLKFSITNGKIENMQAIDFGPRAKIKQK